MVQLKVLQIRKVDNDAEKSLVYRVFLNIGVDTTGEVNYKMLEIVEDRRSEKVEERIDSNGTEGRGC
jgi:hypothetical protein